MKKILLILFSLFTVSVNGQISKFIKGNTGSTGSTGIVGATGSGINGVGITGNTGSTGTVGATGSIGSTGFVGATGTNGNAGSLGATGQTGSVGNTGVIGSTGQTGSLGSTGATGTFAGTLDRQVVNITNVSTTSIAFTPLTGASLTVANVSFSDKFLIIFSAQVINTNNDKYSTFKIQKNGVDIAGTTRRINTGSRQVSVTIQTILTGLIASDVVRIVWLVESNTGTVENGTLTISN